MNPKEQLARDFAGWLTPARRRALADLKARLKPTPVDPSLAPPKAGAE